MPLDREYLFIRHARPENDTQPFRMSGLERDMRGEMDRPLAPLGRRQAEALAEALADRGAGRGVERVVSSELRRAKETADLVAARLGREVRDRRPGLNELRPGHRPSSALRRAWVAGLDRLPIGPRRPLEGATAGLLAVHYLIQWRLGRTEGGDDWEGVPARLLEELRWLDSLPERRVAVVCHGYLIWHLATRVLSPPPSLRWRMAWVPNVSVTTVLADGRGRYALESFARDPRDLSRG